MHAANLASVCIGTIALLQGCDAEGGSSTSSTSTICTLGTDEQPAMFNSGNLFVTSSLVNVGSDTKCCKFEKDIANRFYAPPTERPADCPTNLVTQEVFGKGECSGENKCLVSYVPDDGETLNLSVYGFPTDCCESLQAKASGHPRYDPASVPADCLTVVDFCMVGERSSHAPSWECSWMEEQPEMFNPEKQSVTASLNVERETDCCKFRKDIAEDKTPTDVPTDCPTDLEQQLAFGKGSCSGDNWCTVSFVPVPGQGTLNVSVYGFPSDCCEVLEAMATGHPPASVPADCLTVVDYCMVSAVNMTNFVPPSLGTFLRSSLMEMNGEPTMV